MAKKGKVLVQSGSSKLLDQMVNGSGSMTVDENGHMVLRPTTKGQEEIAAITKRRLSKKSNGKTVGEPVVTPAYTTYDTGKVTKLVGEIVEAVKAGKYLKAMKLRDMDVLNQVIDVFLNMPEEDFPLKSKACEDIRLLLRIGKSFYEYDSEGREFLTDDLYDRLIAKYRGMGLTEPNPYAPKGKLEKSGIKYPRLHNNMDKAYAIRIGDPIPSGVKETDRIESFLIRCYEAIGLSPEAEIELELSPKLDGTSVNGTILKDTLLNPQTRGDDDKSVKVIGLNGLEVGDDGVDYPEFGLQYELFITNEDREIAGEYLKHDYVSNRHCASGLMLRLCTVEDDDLLPRISLFPIEADGLDGTYKERMEKIQQFAIVPKDMIDRKIIKGNLKELLDKIEKTFKKYEDKREDLSYSIDGMVITVADDDYQDTIGRNGRTNLYQIALKFDPQAARAEVKGIYLDNGKKGFRTIQVELKHPVFLDGVRYDHVPVLSAKLFEDMKLRVGSEVEVRRVGDVIPSINVIHVGDGKVLRLPSSCPDCSAPLEIKNKKLYCSNGACSGNLAGKISGFLAAIGMDGYSDGFAEYLLETFGSDNPKVKITSLYELSLLTDDVLEEFDITRKDMQGFANRLRKHIEVTPDYILLGSIGLPDIGPARAKLLLKELSSLDFMRDGTGWVKLLALSASGLDIISDAVHAALGKAVGDKFIEYFNTNVKNYSPAVRDLVLMDKYNKNITTNFDSVLRVGHTGVTPDEETKTICQKNQFDLVDGKSFDILITGSMDSGSEKMKKAKANSLPIYTVEAFKAKYGNK